MPYKDYNTRLEYSRNHYKNNKQKYLDRNRVNRAKLRKYVSDLKESKPCSDCGVSYPHYVMDFDHINNKEGLIIDFIRRYNKTALDLEIAKCELVCSNCHRIRSQNRIHK